MPGPGDGDGARDGEAGAKAEAEAEAECLRSLEAAEQQDRVDAMSAKQLKRNIRKLKRDIQKQKQIKRQRHTQQQRQEVPAAAAASLALAHPLAQPPAARRRVGQHWGDAAALLASEPPTPRPYPYHEVEALMWVAGDVCSCGTAGVGTVDWMVDELHEWGSALVAEAAARHTAGGAAAAAAGVQVAVRLKDVQALLPVACAQYEELSTETKKARTAQHLESHKTEVADLPAAELRSVAGGQQAQVRTKVQHLRGTSSGPHSASGAATVSAAESALPGANVVEMGVESSKDFIAFADERTERMRSRSELFAFTKARETSLLRRNRPARRGGQKAAVSSGTLTHRNDFVDWLLGHSQAGCHDNDFARPLQPLESAWDDHDDGGDEDDDYDNIDEEDTGASAATVRPTAGGTHCSVTIGSDARGVIASMLRSRLFGIVSVANRARHAQSASTRDGEAVGQLRELSCALTVVELVEAKLQLPRMLPCLSWGT